MNLTALLHNGFSFVAGQARGRLDSCLDLLTIWLTSYTVTRQNYSNGVRDNFVLRMDGLD